MNRYQKLEAENALLRNQLREIHQAESVRAFCKHFGSSIVGLLATTVKRSDWPKWLDYCLEHASEEHKKGAGIWLSRRDESRMTDR